MMIIVKKVFTFNNVVFFIAIAMFFMLIYQFKGEVETITPGQELRAECVTDDGCLPDEECYLGQCEVLSELYPYEGSCNGRDVMVYGKPSFYTDPAMQHMVRMPCSNDDQCNHWPPLIAGEESVECCMNTGFCVGKKA